MKVIDEGYIIFFWVFGTVAKWVMGYNGMYGD